MKTITSDSVLPRAAAAAIERAARIAPVVVLLGARQTGKTTLLHALPLLEGHLTAAGVLSNLLAKSAIGLAARHVLSPIRC